MDVYRTRQFFKQRVQSTLLASMLTLVTDDTPRKNTANSAKKTLHGCTACATAVSTAAPMPVGVRERFDMARATRRTVKMVATTGCILVTSYAHLEDKILVAELEARRLEYVYGASLNLMPSRSYVFVGRHLVR